ncbi:MAG: sigma-54-dependent Fis family transcriptional regulator, partial [Pseudohongiellaceae bacterium]
MTETQVLLIDDDNESRGELAVILKFLGEHVIQADSGNWRQRVGSAPGDAEPHYIVLMGSL